MPNPKYAVSVVIENGESGGSVAGPVAIAVMNALIEMIRKFLNLFRNGVYFDQYLFISITLLSLMGLVFLFSASQGNIETTIKQSFLFSLVSF